AAGGADGEVGGQPPAAEMVDDPVGERGDVGQGVRASGLGAGPVGQAPEGGEREDGGAPFAAGGGRFDGLPALRTGLEERVEVGTAAHEGCSGLRWYRSRASAARDSFSTSSFDSPSARAILSSGTSWIHWWKTESWSGERTWRATSRTLSAWCAVEKSR